MLVNELQFLDAHQFYEKIYCSQKFHFSKKSIHVLKCTVFNRITYQTAMVPAFLLSVPPISTCFRITPDYPPSTKRNVTQSILNHVTFPSQCLCKCDGKPSLTKIYFPLIHFYLGASRVACGFKRKPNIHW